MALELGDLPTWAAVILSIYSIYRSESIKTESQKETRLYAQLLDIKNDVNSLKNLAFLYWLNEDKGNSSAALEIKLHLKTIPAKLANNVKLWAAISHDFIELRRLISGGDFEVIGREPLTSNSVELNSITSKLSDILQKINKI